MATAAVAAVSYITGLTGAAAVAATTAIATVAVTATAALLVNQPDQPRNQGQLNQLNLASNAPRSLQIGTRGNGGALVDWYTYGHKNQYAELVIYLGEGPYGQLTGVWSLGRKVYNGTIQHGQRVQLTEFDSPDGRAWVEYYDGRPGQTASTRLVSATSNAWTSSNVGTGCAYVIVTCRWDPDTMPAIASFFFETEGAKLYDRRKDSTAGGSGLHRLKDPSTWEVSSNPAVALDHYMLGRYLDGSSPPVFGIGLDPSVVSYERFATQANLCDEPVTTAYTRQYVGNQPRYAANGFIFSDDGYRDVIIGLCRSMNARPADLGGQLGVIDNEAKAPVLDVVDGDVVEGSVEIYSPKKPRDQLIGGIRGNYQDPENNYNPTDYPSVTDADWAAEDGEQLEFGDFDLDFETDPERAQRLALLHARRERRQATLNGVYSLRLLELEDGDWFTRTTEKFPSGKIFEVVGSPVMDTETMSIRIDAVEVDASDTAWTAAVDAIATNQPQPSGQLLPAVLDVPAFTVAAVEDAAGTLKFPVAELTNTGFDASDPSSADIMFEIYRDDGNGVPTGGPVTVYLPRSLQVVRSSVLMPSTDYLVRGQAFIGQRRSAWTDYLSFTTTENLAVQQAQEAIAAAEGSALADALAAIDGGDGLLQETLLSAIARLEEQRLNLGNLGVVEGKPIVTVFEQTTEIIQTVEREVVRVEQELGSALGDAGSQITDLEETISTETTARAQAVQSLLSQLRTAEASIQTLSETTATDTGAVSNQVNALRTEFEANVANVIQQINTLVQADQAEAAARALLEARVDNADAAILREERARATADEALTQRDLVQQSAIDNNRALISEEATTRANETEALARDVELVQAQTQQASAALGVERQARATQFEALANYDLALNVRLEDVESGQSATASTINAIEARVRNTENGLTSSVSRINALENSLNSSDGTVLALSRAIDTVNSRLVQAENSITAQTQQVNIISSQVGSAVAQVSQVADTVADLEGNANAILGFTVSGGGNSASLTFLSGNAYGSYIELDASTIRLRGDVIVDGTLTANKIVSGSLSTTNAWTGGSVNLSATGAYTRIFAGTVSTDGYRVVTHYTVQVANNYSEPVGFFLQLRVQGSTIESTVHYLIAGFPDTISITTSWLRSKGVRSIELWAKAVRGNGGGATGVRSVKSTVVTQELKR